LVVGPDMRNPGNPSFTASSDEQYACSAMPWVNRRVDTNPMPYGSHPLAMTPPYWVQEWVGPTPEEEAMRRRDAERQVNALRAAIDADDMGRMVGLLSSPPRFWGPWDTAVRDLWSALMSRGQLGEATHDLLRVRVASWPDRANDLLGGDYFTERWTEHERTPAWHAPSAGNYRVGDGEGSMDVWLTIDGEIWAGANPACSDGGGFRYGSASRDIYGVLLDPDLVMAVRRGESVRVARSGFWHTRRLRVLNATAVVWGHEAHSPFSASCDLDRAVRAACDGFLASGS
jgi:hypothetical protein